MVSDERYLPQIPQESQDDDIWMPVLPKRLSFSKDTYAYRRCFIIGNGPSINQMDLSPLKNEHYILVNKGYQLAERGLDRPTFYGMSDPNACLEYGHCVPPGFAEHICLFRELDWKQRENDNLSIIPMYTDRNLKKYMSAGFFQFDLHQPAAHTYTIVLQMLQVAVYAGYKDIYFLGVDNDFKVANMHFYPDSAREKIAMTTWGIDPCPDTAAAFSMAQKLLRQRSINLFNAGVGGKLESLPRVNFKDLF